MMMSAGQLVENLPPCRFCRFEDCWSVGQELTLGCVQCGPQLIPTQLNVGVRTSHLKRSNTISVRSAGCGTNVTSRRAGWELDCRVAIG
jgi:hypothetical protein